MNWNEYLKASVTLRLVFIVLSCRRIDGIYLYYNSSIDGYTARVICESNRGKLPDVGSNKLLHEPHWVDNKLCNRISECVVEVKGGCLPKACNEKEKLYCQVDSRCISKDKSRQLVSEINSGIHKTENCEEACCQMKTCIGINYENENCIMYEGGTTEKEVFIKENTIETMNYKENVISETIPLCQTDFLDTDISSIETSVTGSVQPTSTFKVSSISITKSSDLLSTFILGNNDHSYTSPTTFYTARSKSMTSSISVIETTKVINASPIGQPIERSMDLYSLLSPSFSSQCFCRCHGPTTSLSEEESKRKMSQLREELTIPTEDLSSTYRKKTSMPDDRVSAKSIGFVGVGIMCFVFGGIIILDLGMMARHLRILYNNIC